MRGREAGRWSMGLREGRSGEGLSCGQLGKENVMARGGAAGLEKMKDWVFRVALP